MNVNSDALVPRTLATTLKKAAGPFPVAYVTGPRQSGKTTLARETFPEYRYISLENPRERLQAIEDPDSFLRIASQGAPGVILDEAQRAPDLFSFLQGFVDERRGGPFVLTGSQNFLLTESITQSLAGRAAVLELYPFSRAELDRRPELTIDDFERSLADAPPPARPSGAELDDALFAGMFPPIHHRRLDPAAWFDSYIVTYVERDARQVSTVGDLAAFQRFLGLCAGRSGQLLNIASLSVDAGIDRRTANRWLSILQASYMIAVLPPHFVNFSRRLVKTPKLYFVDTGLMCSLLGITDAAQLRTHPLRGSIFETYVVSELVKVYAHHGRRPRLHFWRDKNGIEIDLLLDFGTHQVPMEIKSGETPNRSFFSSLGVYRKLAAADHPAEDPYGVLVYGGDDSRQRWGHTVRPWWACS
jgi:predicted AAA+ superfamily ATPase